MRAACAPRRIACTLPAPLMRRDTTRSHDACGTHTPRHHGECVVSRRSCNPVHTDPPGSAKRIRRDRATMPDDCTRPAGRMRGACNVHATNWHSRSARPVARKPPGGFGEQPAPSVGRACGLPRLVRSDRLAQRSAHDGLNAAVVVDGHLLQLRVHLALDPHGDLDPLPALLAGSRRCRCGRLRCSARTWLFGPRRSRSRRRGIRGWTGPAGGRPGYCRFFGGRSLVAGDLVDPALQGSAVTSGPLGHTSS